MGFIGKIFKNKQIVTIAALIVCFLILVVAYNYRVNQAIDAVNVPVAKEDLQPRTLITEDCFETIKVAQSMLTSNVIINTSELVGEKDTPAKYVNYNTFIPKGSMFYKSAVTTWDNMPDSAWSDIPDGNTVISLDLDEDDVFGNSIFPGDKIDLYFTGKDTNGKYYIGPLIKGITVLAVKSNGTHIFKRTAEQTRANNLIFSVEDSKFLFLKRAMNVGGRIIPVPRNAQYTVDGQEQKGSQYITNIINSNSKVSTDDVNTNKKNEIKLVD